MSPLDALWHILNLFAPALGLGLLVPGLAKLVWRKHLRATSLARLWAVCTAACALCVLAGLLWLGRDGKMLTYAGLVLVSAASVGWMAFGPGRGSGR